MKKLIQRTFQVLPATFRHHFVPDIPHHFTQCGNDRQSVFGADSDRGTVQVLWSMVSWPAAQEKVKGAVVMVRSPRGTTCRDQSILRLAKCG